MKMKDWMNHSFDFESITNSRFDRKFALISLLNLWHQLLAPHVKVSNLATAKKYSRDLPSENMKSVTAAGEDKSMKQTTGTTVSIPVSGSIANSGVKGKIRISRTETDKFKIEKQLC
ncbi:hypothetical protein QQG55_55310 [Brugia pahangi]